MNCPFFNNHVTSRVQISTLDCLSSAWSGRTAAMASVQTFHLLQQNPIYQLISSYHFHTWIAHLKKVLDRVNGSRVFECKIIKLMNLTINTQDCVMICISDGDFFSFSTIWDCLIPKTVLFLSLGKVWAVCQKKMLNFANTFYLGIRCSHMCKLSAFI